MLLASRGEIDRGLAELATAEKLDPLSPTISNLHGSVLLSNGRIEEALAEGLRTKEIDPTYVYFESSLAGAYREQGKFAESIAEYKRQEAISGETPSGLAITYARMGRKDEAREILQRLETAARTRYIEADLISAIYVALGENDMAFQWLERAFAEHSAPLEGIAIRADFKPLASDPRFAAFLRRIGIDPAKVLRG
jgi:tetratricopeptide (TPR) repeat protein